MAAGTAAGITDGRTPGLRWGVIGTGGIAAAFTADLAHLPGSRVVAVGSRTRESAEAFGDRFDVRHRHAGHEALVADPEVDAVYVATPHPGHADAALLAVAAGKHVLVEKPFTMDAVQARLVVGEARAAGVFGMEAMWTRLLPHMVRLRDLLAAGARSTPSGYAPTRLRLTRRDGRVEEVDGRDARIEGPRGAAGKGLRFEAAEVARCVAEGRLESDVMPLDETVAIMETMDEIGRQASRFGPHPSTRA